VSLIPSEFQLGGITWKVRMMKRLPGKLGDCNIQNQEIRIRENLPQDVKEQTFYHELVHAIKMAMGINGDDHDEVETDAFAMFLHQYEKTKVL
jgi:hypothetical protein